MNAYKSTGEIVFEKNQLRYSKVKDCPGILMDNYGRVFETGKPNEHGFDSDGMKLLITSAPCYANH